MTKQEPIASAFGPLTTAQQIVEGRNLDGKIILITGGHSGIGLETTRVLAAAGAKIYIGARDLEKAKLAVSKIENVQVLQLDLSDPKSIDLFSEQFLKLQNKLHILINNAGVMALPELTRDRRGYELQFATNHLGHFQLTTKVWQALKNANGARVVNLTSAGHRFSGVELKDPHFMNRPYEKWKSYGQSKSANSLFNVELDERGKAFNIRAFAVHPGRIIDTNLLRYMSDDEVSAAIKNVGGSPIKTIEQGAATTVWCALSESLNELGGVYCSDCNISAIVPDDSASVTGVRMWAIDQEIAKKLWSLSESETAS